ncbi:MAG: hypothetical protein ACRDTR_11010, partial [Rubrobacter sp.]
MTRRSPRGSRAATALLLFCVLLSLFACDFTPDTGGAPASNDAQRTEGETPTPEDVTKASNAEITRAAQGQGNKAAGAEPAMDTVFVHRASQDN